MNLQFCASAVAMALHFQCGPLSASLRLLHHSRRLHKPPLNVRCSAADAGSLRQPLPQEWNREEEEKKKKKKSIAGVDQALLLDPWLLADTDSRFAEYNGVQVHYKISRDGVSGNTDGVAAELGSIGWPGVLLHGFGASVFSWERVLRPLSKLLSAPAVAFDRPGFGLTSRVLLSPGTTTTENPYSLDFSAAVSVAFIDFLKADKAVLIGHSAGCIVAAEAYFKAPERIGAIVMIAPAITAPLMIRQGKQQQLAKATEKQNEEQKLADSSSGNPAMKFIARLFLRLRTVMLDLFARVAQLMQNMREVVAAFYCKILSTALRSRAAIWMIQQIMDKYGEQVVRNAWYNPEKAEKYVIQGYTKPLGCRHWDRALLEFVVALVASKRKGKKLGERLGDISCPVLVITGDTDRLVPAWNAKRLAKVFPKSSFHMIKECGHLPHEEKPEEVIHVIKGFIASAMHGRKTTPSLC